MSSLILSSFSAAAVVVASSLAIMPVKSSAHELAVPEAKAAAEMFEGRIVLATKAAVTIVAKNGDNLMFTVAADCKVTRDGKPSSVDMLGVGDRVMIAASSEADRKVANVITARGPERPSL